MQKYWLADNGEVRCLDDRCPQECDMGCPIYLQTIALEYFQKGHFKEAAGYFEKAVKVEPTFAEAWNNLAACYGQMGDHQRAYEAYLKSFELLPKPKPLYGMAVASKNMGKFAQATQYTCMYERRFGSDEMIRSVIADIVEAKLVTEINGSTSVKASPQREEPRLEDDMHRFGAIYLTLMDESMREKGYAELEKLAPRFPEAGVVLGQYYHGTDPAIARKYFKLAADKGIAEAQWGYSQMLPHSRVLDFSDPRDKEYLKYCLAAAQGGCPDAANEMGNICHRKQYYEESTYWYGMAYCLEHPSGMTSLRGITKEWLQNGGVSDQFNAHLDGFSEDMRQTALKLYKMFNSSLDVKDMDDLMTLTMGGENLAGFIMGQLMEQRNGDEIAYDVYNALAFGNHPHALRCYADLLMAGKGTERDVGAAFRIYEKAAKGGNAVAMFAMGQKAVKDGDKYLAAAWFGQAYTRGFEMADDWLSKLADI